MFNFCIREKWARVESLTELTIEKDERMEDNEYLLHQEMGWVKSLIYRGHGIGWGMHLSLSYLDGQLLEAIYIIKHPALHAAGCVVAWTEGVAQGALRDPTTWGPSGDELRFYRRSGRPPPPWRLMFSMPCGRFKGRLAYFLFFLLIFEFFSFLFGVLYFSFFPLKALATLFLSFSSFSLYTQFEVMIFFSTLQSLLYIFFLFLRSNVSLDNK